MIFLTGWAQAFVMDRPPDRRVVDRASEVHHQSGVLGRSRGLSQANV
jgi:hypothetical protein